MTLHRLLVLSLAFICAAAQTPVRVSVFYESRCPDSVFFVASQLKPAFDALGPSRMVVDFVPYGKATHVARGNGFVFHNQHGRLEYVDNKMHACAIDALTGANPGETVDFIACAMDRPERAANTDGACFHGISPAVRSKIKRCHEGVEGNRLLAGHGDRTHALYPKISLYPNQGYIPRIMINGVYNEMEERMANENLKALICSKFQGVQQQECQMATPSSTLQQSRSSVIASGYPQNSPNYPVLSTPAYPSNPSSGYSPVSSIPLTSTYPGYPSYQASDNNRYPGYPMPSNNAYPGYPGYPVQSTFTYPANSDPVYQSQTPSAYPGYDVPMPYTHPMQNPYYSGAGVSYPGYPTYQSTQHSSSYPYSSA